MNAKDNVVLLKRLQAMEIVSTRLLGGWLPGVVRWEHKHAIAYHLWQDACHSRDLRTRLWELRVPKPDRSIAGNPERLRNALAAAPSDFAFLFAHYNTLKRAVLDAYRSLVRETHPVYDAPSISVVRRIIQDKEEQLAWADEALPALMDDSEKRRLAKRWAGYVESLIEVDGGIGRTEPSEDEQDWPDPPPGCHLSPLPFSTAHRDERFNLSFAGMPPPGKGDQEQERLYQFVNYAHEMQAAETLGSILWETDGMDWEFYYDLARHCYDEARHSRLGEERLGELGYHITDFPHCVTNYAWRQLYDPLRRYAILACVIEPDSFKYKHETYQRYVETGDLESAEAVLYDITDETLHVRCGQKWVPKMMEQADYGAPIDDLVDECREILLKHTTNPVQREYAQDR